MKCLRRSYLPVIALIGAIGVLPPGALAQPRADSPSTMFPDLITLAELPGVELLAEIEVPVKDPAPSGPLARSGCFAKAPALDERIFRQLMSSATAIRADDPSIRAWHYAPWCDVGFRIRGERYTAQLFLGGRGILRRPDGRRGMFSYVYPRGADP